jgi:predicted enzyme related to lactoylglutathione lyase
MGVAQVVVNLPALPPAEAVLAAAGYEVQFREEGIPNHPAKAPFQAARREELAMVHFSAPAGGTAVELTAYAGEPPAGRPAYRLATGGPRPLPGLSERVVATGRPGVVAEVELHVADPEASAEFWTAALGFRRSPGMGDRVLLERIGAVPAWALAVSVHESQDRSAATVDADGCVLVTFVVTALDDDLARIAAHGDGVMSSPAWRESVGGGEIRVAMAAGPSGEPVELLELGRPGRPRVPATP